MAEGIQGHRYLIGGDMELTNLELLKQIQLIFNLRRPDEAQDFEDIFEFVTDRKGHDRRYAIDTRNLKSQFPKVEKIEFTAALSETVDFHLAD